MKKKKKKKTQTTQFKNEQRTWIDISLKNKHRSLTGTWKDAQDHKSSGKNKPIPQWDIISHLSEWLLSKRQQIINVGEDVKQREP